MDTLDKFSTVHLMIPKHGGGLKSSPDDCESYPIGVRQDSFAD